ncbi:hypothetical protein CPB85DRAFT_1307601 [Mucidula mucida]|nr:hypothetical protein CPB85DRAFT_1307601 [Mucidula mucida]
MPPYISLHQISTQLPTRLSKTVRYSFTPSRADVDCTEYCLGLKRGEIENIDSSLLVTSVQNDMVSLLQRGQWTLLPTRHTLEKIRDLYIRNHENGTFNRTEFLEAIPEGDYDYQFLCLSLPHHRQWHVDGVACPFPVEDFPAVRTRIHPCFLFSSLMAFIMHAPNDQLEYNFPKRMTPFARRDLPEHLPRPNQPPIRQESTTCRPASNKHITINSPRKTTTAILKLSSFKAPVSRKPQAKKRKISQSAATSAVEEVPLKQRRSPRFAQT